MISRRKNALSRTRPADALGVLAECLHRVPAERHACVSAALRVTVAGDVSLGDLLQMFDDAGQNAEAAVAAH